MTVLTLHSLYCILCCGSAELSLSFGSHGRQMKLQEEAGLEPPNPGSSWDLPDLA